MASIESGRALQMFRRMMKQVRNLPEKDRVDAQLQIRSAFIENRSLSDENTINNLLTKAESTLGYLKMITPKTRGQSERYRKIFGSTDDVTGRKATTNWHGGNMDPDSVARHAASLKRAGFKNNAHAKGFF